MTTTSDKEPNVQHLSWLQQIQSQKMLMKLRELYLQKLATAARQAKNLNLSDVQLRLFLREADVVEEIAKVITENPEYKFSL